MTKEKRKELRELLESLQPPMPEGKEHLVYRDFPKMPEHVWEWMLEQLKDYELEILTNARYKTPEGVFARGQVFVHPDGLNMLREAFNRDRAVLFPVNEKSA